MTLDKSAILAVILVLTPACGHSSDGDDDKSEKESTGPAGDVPDTSEAGIHSFLEAGSYSSWPDGQPAPIDSAAAHAAKTRTFFNPTAATAARAGENPLPKGSVLVKEIFEADGTTLRAHALMAKIADGSGGDTWVWYEGFAPTYANPYYGVGHSSCVGCHSSGTDFVRTSVP